jgi:serine/threonine protein phosphatase 1
MSFVKRFEINANGRDFAVGDIHGHFSRLQVALKKVSFDPSVDRLFSVGDLVDRGPESAESFIWLNKPWFHAVRGNHEQMAIDTAHRASDAGMHFANGGAWFLAMNWDEQQNYSAMFSDLPIAMQVETANGLIGIVHADCPYESWQDFLLGLETAGPAELDHIQAVAQWSRSRINAESKAGVKGVRALVVGHTPIRSPVLLGNVIHIDTAGWTADGHFTLLDLSTLQTVPPMAGKLIWEAA